MTTEAEALANILAWSADSPGWQRDALRRPTQAVPGQPRSTSWLPSARATIRRSRWKRGIFAARTAIRGRSICGRCMESGMSMLWLPTNG